MWQWFLDFMASSTPLVFGLAGLFTLYATVVMLAASGRVPFLEKFVSADTIGKWKKINKGDCITGVLIGIGVTAIVVMFLHGNNKLTILDFHGDYLECRKCHKSIDEIICSHCGEKYNVMPVDGLPWKTVDSSDY